VIQADPPGNWSGLAGSRQGFFGFCSRDPLGQKIDVRKDDRHNTQRGGREEEAGRERERKRERREEKTKK